MTEEKEELRKIVKRMITKGYGDKLFLFLWYTSVGPHFYPTKNRILKTLDDIEKIIGE